MPSILECLLSYVISHVIECLLSPMSPTCLISHHTATHTMQHTAPHCNTRLFYIAYVPYIAVGDIRRVISPIRQVGDIRRVISPIRQVGDIRRLISPIRHVGDIKKTCSIRHVGDIGDRRHSMTCKGDIRRPIYGRYKTSYIAYKAGRRYKTSYIAYKTSYIAYKTSYIAYKTSYIALL